MFDEDGTRDAFAEGFRDGGAVPGGGAFGGKLAMALFRECRVRGFISRADERKLLAALDADPAPREMGLDMYEALRERIMAMSRQYNAGGLDLSALKTQGAAPGSFLQNTPKGEDDLGVLRGLVRPEYRPPTFGAATGGEVYGPEPEPKVEPRPKELPEALRPGYRPRKVGELTGDKMYGPPREEDVPPEEKKSDLAASGGKMSLPSVINKPGEAIADPTGIEKKRKFVQPPEEPLEQMIESIQIERKMASTISQDLLTGKNGSKTAFAMTTGFYEQRVRKGNAMAHSGYDFSAPLNTGIKAPTVVGQNVKFVVKEVEGNKGSAKEGNGNRVVLSCIDEYGNELVWEFNHMNMPAKGLAKGSVVYPGDEIGFVGNTGISYSRSGGKGYHLDVKLSYTLSGQGKRFIKIAEYYRMMEDARAGKIERKTQGSESANSANEAVPSVLRPQKPNIEYDSI